MQVALQGAGMARFGKQPERRAEDLAAEAVMQALERAGVEPADVGAVYVGTALGAVGVGPRIARASGLTGGPALSLEAACASGTVAAHHALGAVARGEHRYTVALGIEMLSSRFRGALVPEPTDADGAVGLPLPGLYALQAHWYAARYEVDLDRLALVSVKNRAAGALNPRAVQRTTTTVEEVLASRPIADPLTFLQCCPMVDGAAAAVFGPASGRPDEVVVAASVVEGGRAWPDPREDRPWGWACVRRAAQAAERMLGEPLSTGSLFEVHDAFTVGEVLTVEALGLVGEGTALDALADGVFDRDGAIPVNPSGGLLARGHPLGATGVAQLTESWLQLRGEAEAIQVPNARRAVVETMGGGASGLDGNCAAVIVLDRV
ncbi:thiolase family protein [Pseudonocardia sp. WMMC193]|uniref:thiolase family protein n=1 Tax=Pseudonocardia sp. WMMC193 TaxID=2911965 RepID=UPI001F30FF03|nr:thiolase family protein [Pseudonocardia sp. WMMC193]MCF7553308.1 thiolase family protein [Pseudonocardia sp. WMMC193]